MNALSIRVDPIAHMFNASHRHRLRRRRNHLEASVLSLHRGFTPWPSWLADFFRSGLWRQPPSAHTPIKSRMWHRAVMGVSSASSWETAGSICACAWRVAMSAAATAQRTSTQPDTFERPGTQWSSRSTGRGLALVLRRSDVLEATAARASFARYDQLGAVPFATPPAWRSACTRRWRVV